MVWFEAIRNAFEQFKAILSHKRDLGMIGESWRFVMRRNDLKRSGMVLNGYGRYGATIGTIKTTCLNLKIFEHFLTIKDALKQFSLFVTIENNFATTWDNL